MATVARWLIPILLMTFLALGAPPAESAAFRLGITTAMAGHTVWEGSYWSRGDDLVRPEDVLPSEPAGTGNDCVVWFDGAAVVGGAGAPAEVCPDVAWEETRIGIVAGRANAGAGYVTAVEAGACNPLQAEDLAVLDTLTFTDANGVAHAVRHITFRCAGAAALAADATPLREGVAAVRFREHGWVTATHPGTSDPTALVTYDFAVAVDMRQFHRAEWNPHPPCDSPVPDTCHDGTGADTLDDLRSGNSKSPLTASHTPSPPDAAHNVYHGHLAAAVELHFQTDDPAG